MRINHDFHIHTTLSLCAHDASATVENYVRNAKRNGITKLGFSNHMWDSAIPGASERFYKPQNYDHLALLRPEIEKFGGDDGIQLYFGCEAEYDPARRDIALTEEIARKFDYILVPNSHTHMMMPKEFYEPKQRHAQFMLDAFLDTVKSPLAKYVTAMAHPFSAVCCPYPRELLYPLISDAQYGEAFSLAREADIAIELNTCGYVHSTLQQILDHPSLRMFAIAKECGCKFIFGSDAHSAAPGDVQDSWWIAYVLAQALDLKEDDIAPIAR